MNEFYDENDKIGFLSSEAEPFSFLSIDNIIQTELSLDKIINASWDIRLGKKK